MKKSKLLVLGLIALVLVGGLTLASCGLGCKGYKGDAKGRCYARLSGGYSECEDECITEQWKKQGSAVDLYCNC